VGRQDGDETFGRAPKAHKGGRPVDFETESYKCRNVVERSNNPFKQWRAIATRYDKLALTYRGGAVLRAITMWLKELGDTP
jgi:transposase